MTSVPVCLVRRLEAKLMPPVELRCRALLPSLSSAPLEPPDIASRVISEDATIHRKSEISGNIMIFAAVIK
jgi:hypothetical protein